MKHSINEIIRSIISGGTQCPLLNEFYDICIKMSMAQLCVSKNRIIRDDILHRMGYSLMDLARDCIDPLFETSNGHFVQIESYFHRKTGDSISDLHEDIVKTMLAVLVVAKTNQELSHLREDFGEIYFKVRKALSVFISRSASEFPQIFFEGEKYIISGNKSAALTVSLIDPGDEIFRELHKVKYNTRRIPEIVRMIFTIASGQYGANIRIRYDDLLCIVNDFYKNRLESYHSGIVEYIMDEENISLE